MTVITVPAEERMLNALLNKARRSGLILETAAGQRYMLVSIEKWAAFEVGDGDDFAREAELTGQNQELMQFLIGRRTHGKCVPLSEVKAQLGLN
ncbi:MAG: hypothetical protein AB1791_02855 [Chloroflexota bacterium]